MIVRYKRAADLFQLAGPQVNFTHKALLTSTLAMFSLVFLTIYSNVKGRLWTSQTNQRYTIFFFWKLGQSLLKTGLLWTHCPQKAYFMDGFHCGDSGHHLLTPARPLCHHTPAQVSKTPPLTGLARLQGTCYLSFSLFCLYIKQCAHGRPAWTVLMMSIHLLLRWGSSEEAAVCCGCCKSQQHHKSSIQLSTAIRFG